MDIGNLVKKRREELGLSRKKLADHIGVSDIMVAHIENNIRKISPERAVKLEGVLGIPRTELCPRIVQIIGKTA